MTQTLEALRHRIHSVEEMQSVVTTMKAMAAVNIRQYEAAVKSLAEYNDTVDMGIQIALRHRPEQIEIGGAVLSGPLGRIMRIASLQAMLCASVNARSWRSAGVSPAD
ncbi:MAG: hypothetical protein P8X64_09860 [Anaerolineales bacterium]